jgi:phosphoribosylformylglycinamidine cyclo-ligase
MIQSQSGSEWQEMYKVFNMGNLLEFYTDETTASHLISLARIYGIEAKIIGRVEPSETKVLEIVTPNNKFIYY